MKGDGPPLSPGARLCEVIIRHSRAYPGGVRRCGRAFLARRMGRGLRMVSNYLRELRVAGRIIVIPPKRVRTEKGWRMRGVNSFTLPCKADPAPHISTHSRRSTRGAMGCTPPLTGSYVRPPGGGGGPTWSRSGGGGGSGTIPTGTQSDYEAALVRVQALIAAGIVTDHRATA